MKTTFEVAAIPAETEKRGRHAWLIDALLANKGKALRLEVGTANKNIQVGVYRAMKDRGFRVRSKTLNDGRYLWIEPWTESGK